MVSPDDADRLLRVQSLHALAYCERLFFLEEVEELRVADAAVYAGRRLHQELDEGDRLSVELSSLKLGLTGKLDALRRRDGVVRITEQKRGRPAPGAAGPESWPSDALQVAAYGLLAEEAWPDKPIELFVRYHQPASLVPVTLSPELRATVSTAIERARLLRREGKRPPVTTEERRCAKCSLAPLCLPEEERVADGAVPRLFPEDDVRQIVHVTTAGARVGKSAQQLKVTLDGEPDVLLPVQQVSALVLHGAVQVSAQALTFLSHEGIGVHWFTGAGDYVGGLASQTGSVHRRVRQFEALRDPVQRNALAQRLVSAKVEHQLRFLLRASRDAEASRAAIAPAVRDLRQCLVGVRHTQEPASLLGLEGAAAARYFSALPSLQREGLDPRLLWTGRSRRPPMDRFNALLSFFYGLVQRDVEAAILAVGLDPAFGLYHQPRGTVGPLVLDVMELFRVPLADMPVMASINRQTWDCEADFDVATSAGEVARVWLSADGRRKAIEVYERRRRETWKHSVLGYSLSYARLMELEVRLLEKEWLGRAGLFASFRLR